MSALADFHFLRPLWLLALLPLALLALFWLRRRLETGAWRDALDPALAPWLVETGWQRGGRALTALALASWCIGVLALAGPSWEQRPQPVARSDDAMVIALDLTLSMYAEDLAPSRMVRARLKVEDILAERADGLTGLVVYAGDSHVVVPLTDDVRTISNLLGTLEPRIMPVFGNRPDRAVAQANQLFRDAGIDRGRVLLVTDDVPEPDLALAAVQPRYPLSILGVGTPEGAPVPLERLNREGHLRAEGQVVIARLEEDTLTDLARRGGGRYARFTADGSDVAHLLAAPNPSRGGTREREREFGMWVDAGPWLVLLLLPVALFAFRRGLLATPLLGLLLLNPSEAAAFEWRDLVLRPDQQAYRALQSGDPERAAERFQDPDWQATALYRSQQYEAAARAFPGDDARAHYNRGIALARAERFEEALASFEAALDRDPEFEDAQFNRDLIERILEQDRPDAANEQASQRDDPSWDDDDEGSAVSRRSDPGEAQPGERDPRQGEEGAQREGEQTEDPQSQSGRSEEQEQLAQAETEARAEAEVSEREQEQALEQWLRRIDDDPAALLQRKFRYEADRRRREGAIDPDERGRPW